MKKFFKVIIAFVLIAGIAFGVYYFLTRGTDNKQIRAKVYSINNELIVDDTNIYEKINQTVDEMLVLIAQRNFDIPETKQYLTAYKTALTNYEFVKTEILEHGVFVNKENTNDYFSNMNKAYENLQKIYEESYDYLLGTYYAVTNPEHHSADYITNFEVLFKDALKELNAFYYNAGMAYCYGVKNTFETNNYYKLKMQYYTLLVNGHMSDYLMDLSFDMPYEGEISSIKSQIEAISVNIYLNNKDSYDTLIAESKIVDLETLTQKVVEGNEQTYLSSIIDEDEKEITQNYYNLVVKG